MIADDTSSIREALRKLTQAKAQGEAEAARKAATDDSKTALPAQRPLFDESGAPFRGFFVTADGEIQPDAAHRPDFNFDQEAWDSWDGVTLDSGVTETTAPLFMYGKI